MNFFPIIASLLNLVGPDAAVLFLLFGVGFFLWMVVDCALNETPEGNLKLVWLLIVIFVPLGSFIYYFVRKRPRAPSPRPTAS
jgi:hypothetical protein